MPTLYYHPLSSFCHKALIALYEHGVEFEHRIVDLGKEEDRAALAALWPPRKFPVLVDEERGQTVPESSIIIEYIDQHYPAAHKLIPADAGQALDVRLWDRFFDGHVQVPLQHIVFDRIMGSKGDTSAQHAALSLAYSMLEERMADRIWVAGKQFSMADCAAAPALFYANTLVPIAEGSSAMAYFKRLMERPSVARVLDETRPWFGMYPFAERLPAQFRPAAL